MQVTESRALETEDIPSRISSTAALKVFADNETGKLEGVTILGHFGDPGRLRGEPGQLTGAGGERS